MIPVHRLIIFFAFGAVGSLLTGCIYHAASHAAAVDVVESPALLRDNRGWLVLPPHGRGPRCLRLRDLAQPRSTCVDNTGNAISARVFSGADGDASMILLVADAASSTEDLPLIDYRLVRRKSPAEGGEALYRWPSTRSTRAVPGKFSLSPDGERLVMVHDVTIVNAASGREGMLALFDLRTRAWRSLSVSASADEAPAWLDRDRIAYVRMVAREDLPSALRTRWESRSVETSGGPGIYGATFAGWNRVPVVFIRSLADGAERIADAGLTPLVSADGKSLLVRDDRNRLRLIDLDRGTHRDFSLPGLAGRGPLGFVGADRVLYWALPTRGDEAGYTRYYSPLVGPRQLLSLKVGDVATGAFATIASGVDPRIDAVLSSVN